MRINLSVVVMLIGCLGGQVVFGQPQPQQLVPAQFTARTDSEGQKWDVQHGGYIQGGTNNTFSSSFQLTVNNSSFSPNTQMMTTDGSEYVLSRSTPMNGVLVTRRIKIDPKKPYIRYCEVLQNPSPNPVTVALKIQVRMGRGQFNSLTSDKGTPISSALGQKDSGVVVWSQQQGQQAVVLFLSGAKSKVKPSIQNQSNYYLYFTWNVTVPGGKKAALVHFAAQRSLPAAPQGKSLEALFKPFRSRSLLRDLPKDLRKVVVNLDAGAIGSWDRSRPLTSLKALGIEPAASDILAVGEKTALKGSLSYDNLTVETRFGPREIPFGNLAAIARSARVSGYGRVFLRDGEVLTGRIDVQKLQFTMNTGLTVPLDVDQIDRLVMRQLPEEMIPDAGILGIMETMDGDRLVLQSGDPVVIEMVTPWGPRKISLDDVQRMEATKAPIGYRVALRDGGRVFGFMSSTSLTVKTRSFGVQKLHPSAIRTLEMVQATEEVDMDEDLIAESHVILKGDNLVVGQIDLERIHILTAGQMIPLPPNQLRLVQLGDEDGLAPIFQGELWDGGVFSGEFQELLLPIRQGENVAMVPVRDIREIRVPSPTVPDALRAKIRLLIRDLGHPEFQTRESAGRELAELGQMARGQLSEAVRLSEDPELRRRAESLLDNLD